MAKATEETITIVELKPQIESEIKLDEKQQESIVKQKSIPKKKVNNNNKTITKSRNIIDSLQKKDVDATKKINELQKQNPQLNDIMNKLMTFKLQQEIRAPLRIPQRRQRPKLRASDMNINDDPTTNNNPSWKVCKKLVKDCEDPTSFNFGK